MQRPVLRRLLIRAYGRFAQVHAGPRAAVLKPFWQTTVALMPTEEKDLWSLGRHFFSPAGALGLLVWTIRAKVDASNEAASAG